MMDAFDLELPAGYRKAPLLGHHPWSSSLPLVLSLVAILSIYSLWRVRPNNSGVTKWVKSSYAIVIMAVFTTVSLLLLLGTRPSVILAAPSSASAASTETSTGDRAIFTVAASADEGQSLIPWIQDPQAVNPQSVCPGYTASGVKTTAAGLTADLSLAGSPCNVYGNDVQHLTLKVESQDSGRLHIEIQPRYLSPENETWFVLPETLVPRPASAKNASLASSNFEFTWSNTPTFAFTVKRKATGDVLFTTNGTKLVYEDQLIEFGSPLPENYNLYGLGEVIHGFRLGNNLTRTIYAADAGDPVDGNIYGAHPIYLDTRYFQTDNKTGKPAYVANATDPSASYKSYTHGVFLRNAHAHEVLLRPSNITWRTLGGSIDLYFYSGPSAEEVTRSYQLSTVGLPAMQQYFTFGFHQCRWGYQNWSVLQDVVDNFKKADIPLETIWTDIDYMNQYRDFDNDQGRYSYSEGAKFLERLHANGQHYVPIVDSAIYSPNPENASDAYSTYDRGVAANAFMLNPDGSLYVGEVWPGYTVFPDWIGASMNGTGAFGWWKSEMETWYKNVSFDGIWIDMSEVSSFCVGSCGSKNRTLNPVHPPFQLPGEPGNQVVQYPEGFNITNATEASSASSVSAEQATAAAAATSSGTTSYLRTTPTPGVRNINHPPYVIDNIQGDLAVHAVSPNATHHGGAVEYDFHNLFGHQILNATYQALLSVFPSKRPFIIGRSTFAGSGVWAGHWGGDNASLWMYMVFSIAQALSFSVFGIPMFGVDTCGFNGNSDMELCSRWMQLSAFFPFYRNHNVLGATPQEPYVWAEVAEASRTAMAIRYRLLPYMYTLFARAHRSGDTVMRALAWEFPDEPWLANADRQFLLGDSLMVTPCLVQGADTVGAVFPGAGDGHTVWYDWYNQTAVATGVAPGQNVTLPAPLGHIPLFVRGNSIIPVQEAGMTTSACRNTPWGLLVALDMAGAASGLLYLDDGESLAPNATTWVELSASKSSVMAQPSGNYTDANPLANVTIMGLQSQPKALKFNKQDVASHSWSYDSSAKVLKVTDLNSLTTKGAWRDQWSLEWS